MFAHVIQCVADRAEQDLTVRRVAHRTDQLAAFFSQFECEFARFQFAPRQGLSALQGHFAARGIGVHKVQRQAVVACLYVQRAVPAVLHGHRDGVFRGVRRDAVAAFARFLHNVGVLAHVVQGVFDGVKGDFAVRTVLRRRHMLKASVRHQFRDFEREHVAFGHRAAFQRLDALEGHAAGRFIHVLEVQGLGIVPAQRDAERSVARIGNKRVNRISPAVTDNAVSGFIQFLNHVGMSTQRISVHIQDIADFRITDRPIRVIVRRGQEVPVFPDQELEYIFVGHFASLKGLHALQGELAFRFIGVNEIQMESVFSDGNLQGTVTAVTHTDRYFICRGSGGHAVILTRHSLVHGVGMCTHVIQGIFDRCKDDVRASGPLAGTGTGRGEHPVFLHTELKCFTLGHHTVHHHLDAFKGYAASGFIDVFEVQLHGFRTGDRFHLAVSVIGHNDRHGIRL